MRVRHGFSPVPSWRVKAPLGVLVAAAVAAGALSPSTAAQAAPVETHDPQTPTATRGPDGLQAPDIATAQTVARLEGERVEVTGERTETSTTWALDRNLKWWRSDR